jgi:predicted HicB family RNase H-like nuclease
MHSVQHPDKPKDKPKENTLYVRLKPELKWRLKLVAAASKRRLQECVDEGLERFASEKERELGLPQQTHQGAA